MKNRKYIWAIIAVISIFGLGLWFFHENNLPAGLNNIMSKSEYKRWITNNSKEMEKISAKKEFGDIEVILNYIPAEKRAIREIGSVDKPGFNEALLEARKFMVYQLRINHKEGLDILNTESSVYKNYDSRVRYFSYDIQKQITLNIGNQHIPCSLLHFERTFGIGKELLLNLAFDASQIKLLNSDPVITWDEDYFGIGKINLSVRKNEINSIPQIKS